MKTIDVGDCCNKDLTSTTNGTLFRTYILNEILDNYDFWESKSSKIELDFKNVKKITPSFANEAFAYYLKYANKEQILNKIRFINIKETHRLIIEVELESGYHRLYDKPEQEVTKPNHGIIPRKLWIEERIAAVTKSMTQTKDFDPVLLRKLNDELNYLLKQWEDAPEICLIIDYD